MSKRTRPHREALLELLRDPEEAAAYLNAAEEAGDMFLIALRNVAEAFQMSKVAAAAGVSRESLYRMLSESGNPTYASLTGIAKALGLRIRWEVDRPERPARRILPGSVSSEAQAGTGVDRKPPTVTRTDDTDEKLVCIDDLRTPFRIGRSISEASRPKFSVQSGTGR